MKCEHIIKISSCVFSLNVLFRQNVVIPFINNKLKLLTYFNAYWGFKSSSFVVVYTIELLAPSPFNFCEFSEDLNLRVA